MLSWQGSRTAVDGPILDFRVFFSAVSGHLLLRFASNDREGFGFVPCFVVAEVVEAYLYRSTRRVMSAATIAFFQLNSKSIPMYALLVNGAGAVLVEGPDLVGHVAFSFLNAFTRVVQFRFFACCADRHIPRFGRRVHPLATRDRRVSAVNELQIMDDYIHYRANRSNFRPCGLPIGMRIMRRILAKFRYVILDFTLNANEGGGSSR